MQAGSAALAFGLSSYSLVLTAAALTFVLHRPTRKLACLRLTALVAGFALARILSTSLASRCSTRCAATASGCRTRSRTSARRGYAFNALQRLLLPGVAPRAKDTTVSGLEA